MYGFNPQMNIDRINQQIQQLEQMKTGFQNIPQQAPVNIYNNIPNNNDFKAQILKESENPNDILVNTKTMFFDSFKGKLYIKEINGDMQEYEVLLPKSKEQIKIEELERKLMQYEQNDRANNEKPEPNEYDNGNDESTTKTNSRSISKQPK